MLKIRLQRTGRSKRPFYRVVVAEHTAPIKGNSIDQLGTYDPLEKPWSFKIDTEKAQEWIKKGAKPSNTVARLLKSAGAEGMEPYIVEMVDRKKKKEEEKKEEKTEAPEGDEAAKPEESTEGQAEAPAEEVKKEEEPKEDKPEEAEAPKEEPKAEEPPADTAGPEGDAVEAPDLTTGASAKEVLAPAEEKGDEKPADETAAEPDEKPAEESEESKEEKPKEESKEPKTEEVKEDKPEDEPKDESKEAAK